MDKKEKKKENVDNPCSCHEHEKCKCANSEETCSCHNEDNKVSKLEAEIAKLNNDVLLVRAEMQNYRKRKEDETANLLKFANQDFMMELIPILDNFERAIKLDDNNLNDELSKFLSGFKMMYSHLVETMKKFGLEEIPALGCEFDPNCMEALMLDCDKAKEDNIVLDVLMKGYRLKDRVIRPVTVKVNKLEEENKGEMKDE